jgi:hypothetical protein
MPRPRSNSLKKVRIAEERNSTVSYNPQGPPALTLTNSTGSASSSGSSKQPFRPLTNRPASYNHPPSQYVAKPEPQRRHSYSSVPIARENVIPPWSKPAVQMYAPVYRPAPTVDIHPALIRGAASALGFDIRVNPVDFMAHHPALTKHVLNKSVTNPPMSEVRIYCHYLPWTFRLTAKRATFVTIEDFIIGLVAALSMTVYPEEIRTQDMSRGRLIEATYKARCREIARYDQRRARHEPMRRHDFLIGYTKFVGLSIGDDGVSFRLSMSM